MCVRGEGSGGGRGFVADWKKGAKREDGQKMKLKEPEHKRLYKPYKGMCPKNQ